MLSTDGQEGIVLEEFITIWQADGTKLKKEREVPYNGHLWFLYAVYFPESTEEYGRHAALLMKIDSKSRIILVHDFMNLSGEITTNYRQQVDEWFERHIKEYG